MTIRIFDFADGFTSASAPSEVAIEAASLPQYANDAAYGDVYTVVNGSIYYNTTDDKVRIYENGSWIENTSFEP